MALEDQVYEALVQAGTDIKSDLWTKEDSELLRQRAKDLVGLQLKVQNATDPQKKVEYQTAAKLIVNHVAMLTLTRLHVAQQHIAEALEKLFWQVLVPKLAALLVGLFV